ncbi:unnamed protein product [Caenorhabditis bovis]|uniref:Protein MIX23 n=1 Tax=Caenorhabditis bovis TaxID=2654633 RepID=A0A8S1FCS4_9PELO|nr:unnamed protein product [Caenorhabditis bovis]
MSAHCFDLSLFIDRLTNLRKSDDRVILELNDTLPTKSFDAQSKICRQHCGQFDRTIKQLHEQRNQLIEECLAVNAAKLEEAERNGGDVRSARQAVRYIRNEKDVEEIVAERTRKAVHDRCRGVL